MADQTMRRNQSMYPGSVTPEPMLPDTNSSLITFNVAALQSMMQAVAREVAERVSHTFSQCSKTLC